MATPVPFNPQGLPSSVGFGVEVKLDAVAKEVVSAVLERTTKNKEQTQVFVKQIEVFFTKYKNALSNTLKKLNLPEDKALTVISTLPSLLSIQISASTTAAGNANWEDFYENIDEKITLKIDRKKLGEVPAETQAAVFSLIADGAFGNVASADTVISILRNPQAFSGIGGIGDFRISYNISDLSKARVIPSAGFNVKLSSTAINAKGFATASEIVVLGTGNGTVTLEIGAKLEKSLTTKNSEDSKGYGKISAGGAYKVSVTLGDVYYIHDYAGGSYAVKVKDVNNNTHYIVVPPAVLSAFGLSSADLLAVQQGRATSNGSKIGILNRADVSVVGNETLQLEINKINAKYENYVEKGTQVAAGAAFVAKIIATTLAVRRLGAAAGPYAAIIAYLPEIIEGVSNIFKVNYNIFATRKYGTDYKLAQKDAIQGYLSVLTVLRNQGILVDQLNKDVLSDIATSVFIAQVAAQYPAEIARRLTAALVTSGVVDVDSYFKALQEAEGNRGALSGYSNGTFSTGDGTLGGAIAVLRSDPFYRAIHDINQVNNKKQNSYDLKLLFEQRNAGEFSFVLQQLIRSGFDPLGIALGGLSLFNASSYRAAHQDQINFFNSPELLKKAGRQFGIPDKDDFYTVFSDSVTLSKIIINVLFTEIGLPAGDIGFPTNLGSATFSPSGKTYWAHGINSNVLREEGLNGIEDIGRFIAFLRKRTLPYGAKVDPDQRKSKYLSSEEFDLRVRVLARVLVDNGVFNDFGDPQLKGAIDYWIAEYNRIPNDDYKIGGGKYAKAAKWLFDPARQFNTRVQFSEGTLASDPGVLIASSDPSELFGVVGGESDEIFGALLPPDLVAISVETVLSEGAASGDELLELLSAVIKGAIAFGQAFENYFNSLIGPANIILTQYGQEPFTLDSERGQQFLTILQFALTTSPRLPDETEAAFIERLTPIIIVAFFEGSEFIRDGVFKRLHTFKPGELESYIKSEQQRVATLSQLTSALKEAQDIARTSGNVLGVLLADIALLFFETQLASTNGETRLARENGAIETGARLLGITFADFVRLIGKGDLAAFGAVLTDAGALLASSRAAGGGGSVVDPVADGFALLGSALVATGRQAGDKFLILTGTALGTLGDILDGTIGSDAGKRSAFSVGFGAAASIANVIGELSGSKEIGALGTLLGGIPDVTALINNTNSSFGFASSGQLTQSNFGDLTVPDLSSGTIGVSGEIPGLFSTGDVGLFEIQVDNSAFKDPAKVGGVRGDGAVAAAALASAFVGALIGGETGARIAAVGSLAQSVFRLVNLNGANPAALALSAIQSFLTLIGVKISPEIQFGLGALGTALTAGFATNPVTLPLSLALFGVQVIFNFLRMGTFRRTSVLADNIDADRDGDADDNALLISEFRRNFFGSVRQTGSTIFYDVETVNPGLLREVQIALQKVRGFANIEPRNSNSYDLDQADAEAQYQVVYNVETRFGQIKVQRVRAESADDGSGRPPNQKYIIVEGADRLTVGTVLDATYAQDDNDSPGYYRLEYETGLYTLDVLGNFNAINPGTAGGYESLRDRLGFQPSTDDFVEFPNPDTNLYDVAIGNGAGIIRRVLSEAQALSFQQSFGIRLSNGDSNQQILFLGAQDSRLNEGTFLRGVTKELDARFTQAKNDPNLYFYLDIDRDGLPDLIRVGQTGPNFVVQGDGKVEVNLLDAPGNTIDHIIANNFAEAEQIAVLRPILYSWGASHPEVWKDGRDLVSLYRTAQRLGALSSIQEIVSQTQFAFLAISAGDVSENTIEGLSNTGDISKRLGLVFDADAYIRNYADIASSTGGDPALAAKHYIEYGNAELRSINNQGHVLGPEWSNGPASTSSDTAVTNYYKDAYGRLARFETFWHNGYRQTDRIDTLNRQTWNWITEIYDPQGRLVSRRAIEDEAESTLTEYNFNPGVNWIRNVSTLDGRRDIKSRTTWYDVNKPVNGGVARTLEEFDTFNENNKVSTISYFDAQDRITLKREIFDNGDIATTNYNYNTSLRYNRLTAAYESVAADPSSGAQPQTAAINTSETGHQNLLYRTNLVQRFEAFRNRDRNVYRPIVEGIFNVVGNIRERITGFYRSSEEERVGYDIQFRAGDAGGGDIGDRIRARLEAAEDLLSRIREFRARAAEPNPVETPPSDAQLIPYIPQRISVGTLIDFVSITDTFNKSGAWTNRRLDLRNGNAFEIASTDGASANVPWTETLIDADGNEVFARATDYFNERARLYKTIEIFDDGTRAETLYEQNNEWVGYSDYTNYYDLDNRFVRQIGRADNGNYWENRWANGYGNAGERSESVLDFNGDESFSSRTNYFNSSGLNYRQTGVRDDGDSWDYSFAARGLATSRTELDTNSDATWASRKSDYNDQGQVTTLTEINDDGTRAVTTYDLANALSYASITNYYDTQNRIVRQYRLLDNGNAQETIWPNGHGKPGPYSVILHDLKNLDASYRTYTLNYNVDGKLVKQTFVRDNGQTDEYVLDPVTGKRTSWIALDTNGSETWTSRKSDYNDQGQVTTLTQINDDGTRAVTTYDVANAQAYVSVTSYYDTQNRLVRQTGLQDNGNFWERQWDNGYGNGGAQSTSYIDANNDEWYASYTNSYDASGQKIVRQTGVSDNGDTWQWIWENGFGNAGNAERIDWDTSGTKPWWQQVADYNAANQLTSFETYYDDKSKVVDNFSNDANVGWTKRTDTFNAAGVLSSQTYT